jgi:hypothetical protein
MVMMMVIKICLRCTTMMNWTTWNLDPLHICSTTQMNIVCFAGKLGETKELWFRCGLCSRWVYAECSAAETSNNFVWLLPKEVKKSRNSDNFLMAYDVLFLYFCNTFTFSVYVHMIHSCILRHFELWMNKTMFYKNPQGRSHPSSCAVLPHWVGNATEWHCFEF